MLRAIVVLLLSLLAMAPAGAQADPTNAVFLLTTYDREPQADGQWHRRGYGTAFFIKSDGTALTVSHVVYRAAHYPEKYRLLAIVGKEFYDATVVCSSKLPYDPIKSDPAQKIGIQVSRDVAEVRLAPTSAFEGRKKELYLQAKSGDALVWATAHTDALPEFPYLTIGRGTGAYARVRVIGFGALGPIPVRWASEGRVDKMWEADDGTPVIDVVSRNPAQPGDSGSPVLNDQNEVVGIWAWHSYDDPTLGTMQGIAAFEKPCR